MENKIGFSNLYSTVSLKTKTISKVIRKKYDAINCKIKIIAILTNGIRG